MASGVVSIIFEAIWAIISEGIKTIGHLFSLFLKLLKVVSPFSSSGPWGFLITILIVGGGVYFLGKYTFHIGKTSIMLVAFGLLIIIVLGSSLV